MAFAQKLHLYLDAAQVAHDVFRATVLRDGRNPQTSITELGRYKVQRRILSNSFPVDEVPGIMIPS